MDEAYTLRKRALELITEGQVDPGKVVLENAIAASRELAHPLQHGEALCRAARLLARLGDHERAVALLTEASHIVQGGESDESLQEQVDCASVLWEIAETLANVPEIPHAYDVARAIKNEAKRRRAIEGVSTIHQGALGSFADAI